MQALWHAHDTVLRPVRRWWLRLAVVAGLAAFAALGPTAAWYKKALFSVAMAAWIGTFPVARICGDRFERALFVCFVPLRTKRWPLDRFTQIETDTAELPGVETAVFVGTQWWLIWALCELMFPVLGGQYKLWLRAASGKRVLAWHGASEHCFRANMETLQRRTGLPLGRG